MGIPFKSVFAVSFTLLLCSGTASAGRDVKPFVYNADNNISSATWTKQESECVVSRTTVYVATTIQHGKTMQDVSRMMFDVTKDNVCTGERELILETDAFYMTHTARNGAAAELTGSFPAHYCKWNPTETLHDCVEGIVEVAIAWDALETPTREKDISRVASSYATFITQFDGTSAPAIASGSFRFNSMELISGNSESAEIINSNYSIVTVYHRAQ